MSYYKALIESDNEMVYSDFAERQKQYTAKNKATMYAALFGGVAASLIIDSYFGSTVASLCGIVGIVWYLLGYHYSQALWDKEKDMTDFYEALDEYEKRHPKGETR